MRLVARLIPLFALGLLTAACSEQSTQGLVAPDESLAPEQSLAAVSSQSRGAVITTDEFPALFFNFDARRGLLSIHGAGLFGCPGQQVNIADRFIVETPSEIQQTLVKVQDGESWVSVHRANSLNDAFPDLCGFLAGPSRVAAGFVQHSQTLTHASFAAHWGGTIQTPEGNDVHLSEIYQLTADAHDPNNPAGWSVNTVQILLSPRP